MRVGRGIGRVLDAFRSVAVAADLAQLATMAIAATGATVVGGPVVLCGAVAIAAIAGIGVYRDWKHGEKIDTLDGIARWIVDRARREGAQARSLEEVLIHSLDKPGSLAALPAGVGREPLAALLAIIRAEGKDREDLLERNATVVESFGQLIVDRFDDLKDAMDLQCEDLASIRNQLRLAKSGIDTLEWLWLDRERPPLWIPHLEDRHENRFRYAARRVTLRGREPELRELDAFLSNESKFRWAAWVGLAGAGKSRLALELCLRHIDDGWEVGFFDWGVKRVPAWDKWSPDLPTLIVFDYVHEHADDIAKAISLLARFQNGLVHKVCILLLERPAPGMGDGAEERSLSGASWWSTLVPKAHGTESGWISETNHDAVNGEARPRLIGGLEREPVKAILAEIAGKAGRRPDDAELNWQIALIEEVDSARRPLFVAMASEAIEAGAMRPEWQAADLVRFVLGRERARWSKTLDASQITGSSQNPWINLYVLSTMCGGLSISDDKQCVFDDQTLTGWIPTIQEYGDGAVFARFAQGAIGRSLPKLEPDVLGELFVLEALAGWSRRDAVLRSAAWRNDPDGFQDFLIRASNSFPNHAALDNLLAQPLDANTIGGFDARWLVGPWLAREHRLRRVGDAQRRNRASATLIELLWRIVEAAQEDRTARALLSVQLTNAIAYSETDFERADEALERMRALYDVYPNDAIVRLQLARGLTNAIGHCGPDVRRADDMLGRLQALCDAHPEDTTLCEPLATGLFNAFNDSEPNSTRADGLLRRLQSLRDARPDDMAVRSILAKGLFTAFNRREQNSEDADDVLRQMRALRDAYPDDATVREELASGLCNAIGHGGSAFEHAESLLDELQELCDTHPDDTAVRQQLAKGVYNAFYNSEPNSERAELLLRRLRALRDAWPEDAAVREVLAIGLFNAFNRSEQYSERADSQLDELRTLRDAYPDDIVVRREYARGLTNATCLSANDYTRVDGLLHQLQELADGHSNDTDVRRQLANGVYNAFHDSKPGSERADGLLERLRALRDAYPNDVAVRERLAAGLLKAIFDFALSSDRANTFLEQLQALRDAYPDDSIVKQKVVGAYCESLANALRSGNADRAAYMAEGLVPIRDAIDALPEIANWARRVLAAAIDLALSKDDENAGRRLVAVSRALFGVNP